MNAPSDPQGTAEELADFSLQEHVDRALSDDFLNGRVRGTIWNFISLSTGLAALYIIGQNRPENRAKRELYEHPPLPQFSLPEIFSM